MKQRVVGAIAHRGQPERPDRRRAHHRARRHHPAPVPEAAEAAPAGDGPGDPLHHARLRHRGPDVRPRGGDVRRPHRGKRAGAADLRAARASLYAGADRSVPRMTGAAGAPRLDRGPAPVADGPARRAAASPPAAAMSSRAAATRIRRRSRSAPSTPPTAGGWQPAWRAPSRCSALRTSAQALPRHQGHPVRATHRPGQGGGRHLLHDPGRRDAGAGRRVRLRQDDHLAADPPPRGADRRAGAARGQDVHGLAGEAPCASTAPRCRPCSRTRGRR